jgi:hypothetical protein
VVGFSSFPAPLLLFAQLRSNFGRTGRATPPPRTIPDFGPARPGPFRGPRRVPPEFMARGEASSTQRRRRGQARSALELTKAAT